jgi:hypothetical protein
MRRFGRFEEASRRADRGAFSVSPTLGAQDLSYHLLPWKEAANLSAAGCAVGSEVGW